MNPYAMCNMYNLYPCGCVKQNNYNNNNYPVKNFPYEWSRIGPMGGQAEPKLIYVPPHPGADIEVETNIRTKISQKPNGLTNMQFPMAPPDLLRRINEERLRTTYQSSFCNSNNYPMVTDYSNWVYNYNTKARLANMQRQESEEVECRPQPKPPYLGGHEIPGRKRNDLSLSVPAKKSNGRKVSSRLSRASREQKQKSDKLDSSQKPKVEKKLEGSKKKNEEMEIASSNLDDSLKNSGNNLEENSYNNNNNNKEDDIEEAYGTRGNFEQSDDDQKNKKEGNSESSDSFNSADSCESKTRKSKDKNNDETYMYLNYTNRRRKYTVDLNNEHFDVDFLPWLSEYQDTIGETGDEILKTKLHYYGKLRLLPDYVAYKKKQADKKKDKDKKNVK
ncbi:dual specificity protein kinase splB-like isoform X1 [Cotesia glomerata]|uniref:dual specificity protein kinase splB-like isoform X1 n=2 Tax=Cotesia glomerata TaxID=32391 RepID=UPI001D015300|nr:dual specificity protein kinase splB-like isoform X1 [Cotesia glomerata]